jgi:hypothetical protein
MGERDYAREGTEVERGRLGQVRTQDICWFYWAKGPKTQSGEGPEAKLIKNK